MKKIQTLIAICVFIVAANSSKAQEICKVLVSNLQGTYQGDCKKGLADGQGNAKGVDAYIGTFKSGYPNGKGKYTWSNGAVYEGDWKMGLRNGEGKYSYTQDGTNKIEEGIWKKDIYTGPKQINPIITKKQNISPDTYFNRVGNGNNLKITFLNRTSLPEDLNIFTSSGAEFINGKNVEFHNIKFPFTCKITYRSVGMATVESVFNFEIQQEGVWELNM